MQVCHGWRGVDSSGTDRAKVFVVTDVDLQQLVGGEWERLSTFERHELMTIEAERRLLRDPCTPKSPSRLALLDATFSDRVNAP